MLVIQCTIVATILLSIGCVGGGEAVVVGVEEGTSKQADDTKSGELWRLQQIHHNGVSVGDNDDDVATNVVAAAVGPNSKHHSSLKRIPRSWSGRKRNGQFFTEWSPWTGCDDECRQRRERFCRVMRKCADTKHVEERRCTLHSCRERMGDSSSSSPSSSSSVTASNHHLLGTVSSSTSSTTATTTRTTAMGGGFYQNTTSSLLPSSSLQFDDQPSSSSQNSNSSSVDRSAGDIVDANKFIQPPPRSRDTDQMDESEFRIIKINHRKAPHQLRPEIPENKSKFTRPKTKNNAIQIETAKLGANDNNSSNFTMPENGSDRWTMEVNAAAAVTSVSFSDDAVDGQSDYDDYAESDYPADGIVHFKPQQQPQQRIYKQGGGGQSSKKYSALHNFVSPDQQRGVNRIYTRWSKWSKCSGKCTTRRFKKCRMKEVCGSEVLREIAYCYTEGSFCEEWIVRQMYSNVPKTPSVQSPASSVYNQIPLDSGRNTNNNYQERKLPIRGLQQGQCGLATAVTSKRRPASHMLRILGGRVVRRGSYPWQVAILNRFKEAFCGGTLISRQWILTAAHCVRKRLYVRLGEHNLEDRDGTEVEYRVEYAIRHPYYDKTTVDNDIALLRLPKEIIPSAYIGFACLPQKYQRLPIGTKCTIIGWGKRKNLDDAGTKYLHEAQVPIVHNEECKEVYDDYTITKNMFCAGHKRGRIDTCSGDSGGPLLYKDPNTAHWSILGVTSFGDGCGKRNKFGIYTKVSNYVDWIHSVIECNGNCRKF